MTEGTEPHVRLPAEWEAHEATWLAYPHHASDWPGKLSAVRWAFVEFVRKIQEHERVRLLVRDAREARRARSALRRGGADPERVEMLACPTDRAWLRDSGPTFVSRAGLAAVCWSFNAWGRYPNWTADAEVGGYIARKADAETVEPRFECQRIVLEGGAIESNGCGTVLTSEQCLLGPAGRNPGLSKTDYEAVFASVLGACNVLWLGEGIAGDDTGGHVDTLARFAAPGTAVASVETDSRDANFAPLRENLRRLRRMRDERGRQLDVVELPMPRPLAHGAERLPASYANFYLTNGAVLVPTFNDPNDRIALRVLSECFPRREVCGIHSVDLVLGRGALHCLAQQQPTQPPRGR